MKWRITKTNKKNNEKKFVFRILIRNNQSLSFRGHHHHHHVGVHNALLRLYRHSFSLSTDLLLTRSILLHFVFNSVSPAPSRPSTSSTDDGGHIRIRTRSLFFCSLRTWLYHIDVINPLCLVFCLFKIWTPISRNTFIINQIFSVLPVTCQIA